MAILFVAGFSYLAAKAGGALAIRPEMIWPIWPGCAFVVAMLLLTPRKIWPAVLAAGIAGFALYDMQETLSVRAIGFLLLGDSIEIIVAAVGLYYLFGGPPRLTSVKSLAKYSLFAVVLAPMSAASVATKALEADSWWVAFLTEALALLTLTPAILSWANIALKPGKKSVAHYLEAACLFIGLTTLAYLTFLTPGSKSHPALLYSLVPFLSWAALRFGIAGTSSSMVVVAFLAILGAVRDRGPFTGGTPVNDVFSLQIFLLVAGSSFMVLAAVVEEQAMAEQAIQSREELLKTFVKNVPAAVAMLDRDMRYVQVSDRWCSDYLPGRANILGHSHYEIFPDMPERWKETHRRALQGEVLRADEDRWDGQDGPRWARWEVRPWTTTEGTVGGILILAEDIGQRKQIEQDRADMTRKLVEAQEQERARIARELHDDINQRLALLAVELEQLRDNPSEGGNHVEELRRQTTEISNDVQALSHDLHSSQLQYLGAVAGMKSWCREFAVRQKVEIDCRYDVRSSLSSEIGICLFRVLQEALHNAAKYSGVNRIEVQLHEDSGEIHLIVHDSGRGFDVRTAQQGKGLGLTSMRERVRLVNGTISIQSKPLGGTTIDVRVPLDSQANARRVAG